MGQSPPFSSPHHMNGGERRGCRNGAMLLASTLLLALPTTNLSPCTLGQGPLLPPRVREGPPRVPIVCRGAFVPSLNLPGREHRWGEVQGNACLQRPLGIMPVLVPAFVYPHMRPMPSSAPTLLQAKTRKLKDDDTTLMDTDKDPHVSLSHQLSGKRIIIVGDVHGCFDELQELLSNVGFQRDRDVLVLAGDFCNKGPQSAAVVRFAREIGALAVVGNHELLSLRARDTMLREGEGCPLSESKYAWTRDLSDADLEYLRSLPFTIRIPMRNALIVHGGLIPGGTLGKQNLLSLITTRTLVRVDKKAARTAGGRWLASTDTARGVPWATQWRGPEHVYFGHTTRRDVMVTPFATGLDTGCVYGGKLSAAVLEAACAEGGAAGRCGACGQELVMTRCSNRYKCKIGACSNKHPCKRSDARCPNVACASSGKPVAAKHKLVAVKARQMYDANLPWKPVGRELAEVKRAAAASARHGASASTLNRLQNKAESVQVGAGAGGGGSVVAPQMDAARRGKRGGKGGSIARVPEDMELRVGAMLAETGPLVQARFLDVWAARYPEAAFDYSAWGFVRLGSALKAMPGAVMLARPEGSLTDTVFPAAYQTLLPYDSANLVSAQGHAAAHKHVRDRRSVSDAAASSVSDVVRHGLAAAVAHEAGAGPDEVAAFLAQPALRFTLDCLVSQFVKYRALQDANGSNCPPSPPPPP